MSHLSLSLLSLSHLGQKVNNIKIHSNTNNLMQNCSGFFTNPKHKWEYSYLEIVSFFMFLFLFLNIFRSLFFCFVFLSVLLSSSLVTFFFKLSLWIWYTSPFCYLFVKNIFKIINLNREVVSSNPHTHLLSRFSKLRPSFKN